MDKRTITLEYCSGLKEGALSTSKRYSISWYGTGVSSETMDQTIRTVCNIKDSQKYCLSDSKDCFTILSSTIPDGETFQVKLNSSTESTEILNQEIGEICSSIRSETSGRELIFGNPQKRRKYEDCPGELEGNICDIVQQIGAQNDSITDGDLDSHIAPGREGFDNFLTLGSILKSESVLSQGSEIPLNDNLSNFSHLRSNVWESISDVEGSPCPRSGHMCVLIDGNVLIFGGKGKGDMSILYGFDLQHQIWNELSYNTQFIRSFATATYVKDQQSIFIFGGVDENSSPISDPVIFDLGSSLCISPQLQGVSPRARNGHSATLIGSNLVIFGGGNQRRCFNDVYVLDVEGWEWSQPIIHGVPPIPRSYHTATRIGNSIVFFGGSNDSGCLSDVFVLKTDTWEWEYPTLNGDEPPSLTRHCSVAIDSSRLLVFGGSVLEKDIFRCVKGWYILDTVNWMWSSLTNEDESSLISNWGNARMDFSCVLIGNDESSSSCLLWQFGGEGNLGKLYNNVLALNLSL